MLSFAINYYFSGFDPFYFKLTNILIHIACGGCLYFLSRQLLAVIDRSDMHRSAVRHRWLAGVVAGIWLAHPLNLTSVLYVVQRMSSLAAFFTFLSVALYVHARREAIAGNLTAGMRIGLLGVIPACILGALCKESALLAPLLMLVVEVLFLRFTVSSKIHPQFLLLAWMLPAIAITATLALNSERIFDFLSSSYLSREFTLVERLLTQPRVLLFYLRLLVYRAHQKWGFTMMISWFQLLCSNP